jgi:hypothetical protein
MLQYPTNLRTIQNISLPTRPSKYKRYVGGKDQGPEDLQTGCSRKGGELALYIITYQTTYLNNTCVTIMSVCPSLTTFEPVD